MISIVDESIVLKAKAPCSSPEEVNQTNPPSLLKICSMRVWWDYVREYKQIGTNPVFNARKCSSDHTQHWYNVNNVISSIQRLVTSMQTHLRDTGSLQLVTAFCLFIDKQSYQTELPDSDLQTLYFSKRLWDFSSQTPNGIYSLWSLVSHPKSFLSLTVSSPPPNCHPLWSFSILHPNFTFLFSH